MNVKEALFHHGCRSFRDQCHSHKPIMVKYHLYNKPGFWCVRIPSYKEPKEDEVVAVVTKSGKEVRVKLRRIEQIDNLKANAPGGSNEVVYLEFMYWSFEWCT